MGLDLHYHNGQIPIDEEEKDDLLIRTISTRGELDELEQANIAEAIEWGFKVKHKKDEVLAIDFIKELHKRMFSEVWDWAGSFRRTNKNIGVDKYSIVQELYKLTKDCRSWIENRVYPEDEIAVRYKFRMVSIHPFPNGNGRHSRICGDILVSQVLNQPVFTWGGKDIGKQGEFRNRYLNALYQADKGDMSLLIAFARSG
ncbi:MAG: mobile mystery protein B [Bacteroidales bacterium]|nr:mobile mystery protein B [Bacteroidales bacterium]